MRFSLFMHSLRQVLRNRKQALRISSPLLIALVLGAALAGPEFFQGQVQEDIATEVLITEVLLQILVAFTTLWVAVGWHRFVLLEEEPGAVLPAFHGGRILAYFGRTILLGLMLWIIVLVSGLALGFVLHWSPALSYAAFAIAVIAGFWLFYRLSPVLPGAAIGKKLTFREAWIATKPLSTAILGAMFVFVLSVGLLAFAGGLILAVFPLLGGLALLAIYWIYALLGISILTTIYGTAVERRQIR